MVGLCAFRSEMGASVMIYLCRTCVAFARHGVAARSFLLSLSFQLHG